MTTEIIKYKLIGNEPVHPTPLAVMRERCGTWAAYQCMDLGSPNVGHLKFLQVGPTNTYKEPPQHYPANSVSQGHMYLYVGMVNLETGAIE